MKTIALALIAAALSAQTPCTVAGTFSASGVSSVIDNRTRGCYQWRVTYSSTGFTALSVQLESAPDLNGVPGTYTAFSGAGIVTDGTNPSTSAAGGTIGIHSAASWVRLNLTSATGAGTLSYQTWGANSTSTVGSLLLDSITGTSPIAAANGNVSYNGGSIAMNSGSTIGTPVWNIGNYTGIGAGITSGTANGAAKFSVYPNGTGNVSFILLYNGSDYLNSGFVSESLSGSTYSNQAGSAGTSTPVSLERYGEALAGAGNLTTIAWQSAGVNKMVLSPVSDHLSFPNSTPAVSACGTAPALGTGASDMAGTIIVGTGTVTSCTLTFFASFVNVPACVATASAVSDAPYISAASLTAVTFSVPLSLGGGTIYYHCM